jgi:phosphonate transport system substrate-binding protein
MRKVLHSESRLYALNAESQFFLYSPQFNQTEFRVLYIAPHDVPLGMVLIALTVERNRQEQLRKMMSASPSSLLQETGYVPNQPLPDYQYMISDGQAG